MKSLVCAVQLEPLWITLPSPWNPKPKPITMTNLHHHHYSSRNWKLYAQSKGFSSRPTGSEKENTLASKNIKNRRIEGGDNDDDDDDEKIPEVVMGRMIGRILGYVGVPLVFGIGLLQVFGIVKEQNLWDVPLWVPFLTTFVTFGASALGVAYGTLSTSWDPEEKGSLLGFEDAQRNWVEMWRDDDGN